MMHYVKQVHILTDYDPLKHQLAYDSVLAVASREVEHTAEKVQTKQLLYY